MKIVLSIVFSLLAGAASAQTAIQANKAAPTIRAAAAVEGVTLVELLAEGYDIIHVDAPVSESSARLILRKGDVIYSCLQRSNRDATGSGRSRGIPSVCEDLTAAL